MSRDMNEVSNEPAGSLEEAHSRQRENCSAKALWQHVVRVFHRKLGFCPRCSGSMSSSPWHIPFRNLVSVSKLLESLQPHLPQKEVSPEPHPGKGPLF